MVHVLFKYVVNRRSLHHAHWLKRCLFLLVGLSSCARSSDLGVIETHVCFFPGLDKLDRAPSDYAKFQEGVQSFLPESGSDGEVTFHLFPIKWRQPGMNMTNIQQTAAQYVENLCRNSYFVIQRMPK